MLRAFTLRFSHRPWITRVSSITSRRGLHLLKSTIFGIVTLVLMASVSSRVLAQHYQQTNLVSDVPGLAPVTDPNLVNPWGLAASSTSPWWVADNGTGLSTLYNGAGVKQGLTVTIPPPTPPSTPTGLVFNGSSNFWRGALYLRY
jgi:hypothetical protein